VQVDEQAGQALALLALVAGQDVEPADGSDGTDGRWRIARRVAEDRVVSTVDPEARHIHKTVRARQDGFKGHVAVEPDTGIFTGVELAKGAGDENHEAVIGLRLVRDEPQAEDVQEVLGDSAYGTADMRVGWPTRTIASPRSSSRRRCARACLAGSAPTTSTSTRSTGR
jgi:hypothetical protein